MHTNRTEECNGEQSPKFRITVAEIKKKVAKDFGITISELESKERARRYARPRQVALYLSRKFASLPYHEIGNLFGGLDHSTVTHAYKLIPGLIEQNTEEGRQLREKVLTLRRWCHTLNLERSQCILPFAEPTIFSSFFESAVVALPKPLLADQVVQEDEEKEEQYLFSFLLPPKSRSTSSEISAEPLDLQKLARITPEEIKRVVADYFSVEPEILDEVPKDAELRFYHQVVQGLQIRLLTNRYGVEQPVRKCQNQDPHYSLKEESQLIAHDINALWGRITSPNYLALV